jgi:WD40 repeat protein
LVVLTSLLGLSGIVWQWREAIAARIDAQAQAQIARDNEGAARRETEFANRRLCGVRMNQVQRFWEDWNGNGLRRAIAEQLPENQRGLDRRGWEWHYWQRKVNSGHTTFQGHTATVRSVAFSLDGTRLASSSDDTTVKIWDVVSGREMLTLQGHTGSVQSVAFSPDGSRLVSASDEFTMKVWDAATGQEIRTIKGHDGSVWSVAFNPDGTRLASTGEDGAKVWDAAPDRRHSRSRGTPARSPA